MSYYSNLDVYYKIPMSRENEKKVNKIAEILQNVYVKDPDKLSRKKLKKEVEQQINQIAESKEMAEETMNFLTEATYDFAAGADDIVDNMHLMFYRIEDSEINIDDDNGNYNKHYSIELYAKLVARYMNPGRVLFVLHGEDGDTFGQYIKKEKDKPVQIFDVSSALCYTNNRNNFVIFGFTNNSISEIPVDMPK